MDRSYSHDITSHLPDKRMTVGNIGHSCPTTYQNLSTVMLEPIFDEIEISEAVLTKIDKSCFGDIPDPLILCDII